MSFILNEDTENAPVFTTLPNGTEVELRILSAEMKNAKSSGAPMLAMKMDVPAEPYAKDIFHNIMLPAQGDDDKKRAQKLNRLKEFKATFGLPASGPIASEDMEGARGWAILREEEGLNGEMQNSIQKFVVGA
jgi:hypothetical protein